MAHECGMEGENAEMMIEMTPPAQPQALEDALVQLTNIAGHLLEKHRELAQEGAAIQAAIEDLYRAQETRGNHIATRLQQASANILAFTDIDEHQDHEYEQQELQRLEEVASQ